MLDYRFSHPIEVRYADLDPQGHLNNAKYFTYMEQARIAYLRHLGLWAGGSFLDIGLILAEARLTFRAPVLFGRPVRVSVRLSRLGNKSFDMEYLIDDAETGQEYATGLMVLVTYDYHTNQTIPIPENWRQAMAEFDGI